MNTDGLLKRLNDLELTNEQVDIVGAYLRIEGSLARNQRNFGVGALLFVAATLVLKSLLATLDTSSQLLEIELIVGFITYAGGAVALVAIGFNQVALHFTSKRLGDYNFSEEQLVRIRALGDEVLRRVWYGLWSANKGQD